MRRTIVILSGNHLCHNPRVIKEATTLARAGYDVTVMGAWFDAGLKARDQSMLANFPATFQPVVDFTPGKPLSYAHNLVARARGRAFRVTQQLTAQARPSLGPIAHELSRAAFAITADLYIAHSEAALAVADELRRSGRRVGVDMEDWYSEDLLPEDRKHRPVRLLRELERALLVGGAYASCPSDAMSAALAREYGCAAPTVVYNAFAWSDRHGLDGRAKDGRNPNVPSIHWFSQTLGEGRGLEDLVGALPAMAHDAEIHLRGHPAKGFERWMSSRLPKAWRERVSMHALVPNDELLSRIAEHDIGFAGEMKYSRSRDLTVSNKMLHYLAAGLAVVASDTAGQREVAGAAPSAVSLYPSGDSAALAVQFNALLASSERLQRAKAGALVAAENLYCWEREEHRLLAAIADAMDAPGERVGTR